jgi:hypothetical protein
MVIGDFEGDLDKTSAFFNRLMNNAINTNELRKMNAVDKDARHVSAVNSRDITLNHVYAKTINGGSHKAHIDLSTHINQRMRADHVFEEFAGALDDSQAFPLPRNFDCLRNMVKIYEDHCEKLTDYSLKYVKYLVKECENNFTISPFT